MDLCRFFPPGGTTEFRHCLFTQAALELGNVLGLKDL